MKQLVIIIGLIFFFMNAMGQEIFFFKEGTNQSFYDQGIVDLNSLGGSVFEHTAPSCCPAYNDKMPCASTTLSGQSALKFNYTSNAGGNWMVSIFRNDWSEADLTLYTDLTFYIYAETGLPATALPAIGLKARRSDNGAEENSETYALSDYNQSIPAGQWTLVKMPLATILTDPANSHLKFAQTKSVVFKQTETNGTHRSYLIDDMAASIAVSHVDPVQNLEAKGYDSHVELTWTKPGEGLTYRVEASFDGGKSYELRGTTSEDLYMDFVREKGTNLSILYRVTSLSGTILSDVEEVQSSTHDFSDEELMEMVQQYTWRYFWGNAHPTYGLIRERTNDENTNRITSGGTGMGLMALIVGHERNFAPCNEIKDRILQILNFLDICPTYHGAFSHWYNGATGQTIPFSGKDDGGDIVETSFVAAGLIALKNYFTGDDAQSVQIRQLADKIWKEIEWNWYRRNNQNVLYWHWSPKYGWDMNFAIGGFNETLVTYIMAASSPTHGVPAEVYHQGWARNGAIKNPRMFYGYNLNIAPDNGGPMFWIHYTHLGLDPHKMKDQYADYWTESMNVAKIQHAYAVQNPMKHTNYSDKSWGITASDDPEVGYREHRPYGSDNGTIAPTAALGSFPYTPEESMKALKYFYRERGAELFGPMGFYDAFNDNRKWVKHSYLAIDQGPILIMMENQRTGLIWKAVMKDADVKAGLKKLGYDKVNTSIGKRMKVRNNVKVVQDTQSDQVTFLLPEEVKGSVTVNMYTIDGRMVKQEQLHDAEVKRYTTDVSSLGYGIYLFSILTGSAIYGGKFLNK